MDLENIEVVDVDINGLVIIKAGETYLKFTLGRKGPEIVSRWRHSQVLDRDSTWLSESLFQKALEKAAAVLNRLRRDPSQLNLDFH